MVHKDIKLLIYNDVMTLQIIDPYWYTIKLCSIRDTILLIEICKLVRVHVRCTGCKLTYGSKNKQESWNDFKSLNRRSLLYSKSNTLCTKYFVNKRRLRTEDNIIYVQGYLIY